eukprot:TRINITY_DN15095_c0_g2_i1.p1 TRINITY_DN15095_c0_g2~~TRINITY_DN15095_c0_g2_i1.p1  ORF type:complete len:515 (+),score=120.00 TRINITY_DN15095_c0_g2_i1:59-1603(+)
MCLRPVLGRGFSLHRHALARSALAVFALQGARMAAAAVSSMNSDEVLRGLDGNILGLKELTVALKLTTYEVTSARVVPGTELRWPQSHSAKLHIGLRLRTDGSVPLNDVPEEEHNQEVRVYLKKVTAAGAEASKPLPALRRDLASNRNEARFYEEFAPELSKRGVRLLDCFFIDDRIKLDEGDDAALRQSGMLLLLDSAEGYYQLSPLTRAQAERSLKLLAGLHAAAWQDSYMLTEVAARLHATAGYWTLEKRGEEEMSKMQGNWRQYLAAFRHLDSEFFARPEIEDLPGRIGRLARWVAKQMAPGPGDKFATIVHGDYKAMNIFLRDEAYADEYGSRAKRQRLGYRRKDDALIIDFQWTGVGFGMSDVAMHLSHSVALEALEGEGERELVDFYRESLFEYIAEEAEICGDPRNEIINKFRRAYTAEVAWRHYCLGVVDYARMLLGCFFANASVESFAARADKMNVGLAYRDPQASLLFVRRADRCLRVLEAEHEGKACSLVEGHAPSCGVDAA